MLTKTHKKKNHRPSTYSIQAQGKKYQLNLTDQELHIETIENPLLMLTIFDGNSKNHFFYNQSIEKINKSNQKGMRTLYINARTKGNTPFIQGLKQNLGLSIKKSEILSLIYKNEKYYRHFQGILPIEMLNYEIQRATKR